MSTCRSLLVLCSTRASPQGGAPLHSDLAPRCAGRQSQGWAAAAQQELAIGGCKTRGAPRESIC